MRARHIPAPAVASAQLTYSPLVARTLLAGCYDRDPMHHLSTMAAMKADGVDFVSLVTDAQPADLCVTKFGVRDQCAQTIASLVMAAQVEPNIRHVDGFAALADNVVYQGDACRYTSLETESIWTPAAILLLRFPVPGIKTPTHDYRCAHRFMVTSYDAAGTAAVIGSWPTKDRAHFLTMNTDHNSFLTNWAGIRGGSTIVHNLCVGNDAQQPWTSTAHRDLVIALLQQKNTHFCSSGERQSAQLISTVADHAHEIPWDTNTATCVMDKAMTAGPIGAIAMACIAGKRVPKAAWATAVRIGAQGPIMRAIPAAAKLAVLDRLVTQGDQEALQALACLGATPD